MIKDDSERGFYMHQITNTYGLRDRPWVARIVGVDARFGFGRQFVRPRHDYVRAVTSWGKTTGGVACFLLEAGWVCEVFEPGRGGRNPDRRYFARVKPDGLKRLSQEEVIAWLTSKR